MASFTEVVEQYTRMCNTYESCDECPMCPGGYCSGIKNKPACNAFVLRSPKVAEYRVMTWAENQKKRLVCKFIKLQSGPRV